MSLYAAKFGSNGQLGPWISLPGIASAGRYNPHLALLAPDTLVYMAGQGTGNANCDTWYTRFYAGSCQPWKQL